MLAGSNFGDALVERALLHDNETQSQVDDDRREKPGRGVKGEHHRGRSLVPLLPDHDGERSEGGRTEDGTDIEIFSLAFALLFLDENERRRQDGRGGKQDPSEFAPGEHRDDSSHSSDGGAEPESNEQIAHGQVPQRSQVEADDGSWPPWGI